MGMHLNVHVFYGLPMTEDEYEKWVDQMPGDDEVQLDYEWENAPEEEYAVAVGFVLAHVYQYDDAFVKLNVSSEQKSAMERFCETHPEFADRLGTYFVAGVG